ncbi:sulfotransferase family protein [Clostridia bacterium]|nr:sulfotransferase family protein [Clostridia bacterium]
MLTIGACGYSITGSSAIINILKEFDEIFVIDKFEFTLAYSPDGLDDLFYHLHKYGKSTSSYIAISRFASMMEKQTRLKDLVGKNYKLIVQKYINDITDIEWYGYCGTDNLIYPKMYQYLKKIGRLCCNIYPGNISMYLYSKLFSHPMRLSVYPEYFLEKCQELIRSLLKQISKETNKHIGLDQPFVGNDPKASFRYFDNPFAFVVDRDPRDLFLFVKKYLRPIGRGGQTPVDVFDFIKYYKIVRYLEHDKCDEKVIRFKLEQLIYDYDNCINQIENNLSIKNHSLRGKYFNPLTSRPNVRLFEKYRDEDSNIKIIEKELTDYLFDFDKYTDICSSGKMFL